MDYAGRSPKPHRHNAGCRNRTSGRSSVKDRLNSFYRSQLGKERIIAVDNDGTSVFHILEHLCFLMQDSFLCFEKFQMSHSNIGDYTDIRTCHCGKLAHFSKMIDSHFQNRNFVFFPKVKDSKGKSRFTV